MDGMKWRKDRLDVYPAYKERSSTIREGRKQPFLQTETARSVEEE